MTAVEWLEKELNKKGKLTAVDFYQAKAMERNQTELSDDIIRQGAEDNTCYMDDFIKGAMWYREQIK